MKNEKIKITEVKLKPKHKSKLDKKQIVIGAINDKDKIVFYKSDKTLELSQDDPIEFDFDIDGNTYFSKELSSRDYLLVSSIIAKYARGA